MTRIIGGLAKTLSLIILFMAGSVSGQTAGNVNTTVGASVVRGVSLTSSGGSDGAGNLNFGLVSPNATATINANSSATAGLYTVAAGPGSSMRVTYTSPSVVLSDGLGNQLTFTPQLVGAQASTSQGTAASVSSGSLVVLSGTGNYYLWLGGSIVVPTGQVGGTYTGTFNITVSY